LLAVAASGPLAGAASGQDEPAAPSAEVQERIVVTARRVLEDLQSAPIPVSVIGGATISDSGAFTVNRLKEFVPAVQFYSSNPRNSALNIRGLGTTFGLTNDGVEPGVGLYVNGVFWARPAQAALDFIDVQQIEVLRGPQGTLYGKNTTAGAINVTTRRPSFEPESEVEVSYGDYNFVQAKASITGPVWGDAVAARLSLSGTQREGFLKQVQNGGDLNDYNNLGVRGQLLFELSDSLEVVVAGDYTHQRSEGYAQVPVRVVPTHRSANRQFFDQAAYFGYVLPQQETFRETISNPAAGGIRPGPNGVHAEFDSFARITDADTPHRSYQDINGQSVTVNWVVGPGTVTSITARRNWEWYPSNDRDFTGLPIVTQSANRSSQDQWSQEIRYAGDLSDNLGFVVGAFWFTQTIDTVNTQTHGAAASRFLFNPSQAFGPAGAQITNAWDRPDLLDGYGQLQLVNTETTSAALFGQLEWSITDRLRILPGLRFNYDEKSTAYDSPTFGGLDPASDPARSAAIVAAQSAILSRQTYSADTEDENVSGQVTVAYEAAAWADAYATYATSFKSFGLNVAGAPPGAPVVVEPEEVIHYEAGLKTEPFAGVTLNLAAYHTEIEDYQTTVVNNLAGTLRGFLANAEEVRVRGAELDGSARLGDALSLYGSLAYTDGEYVSFANSPLPIEETGRQISNPDHNPALPVGAPDPARGDLPNPAALITAPFKDVSGLRLPGVSTWAGTLGAEYVLPGLALLGRDGEYFAALDASYRSDFSSDPAGSSFMVVDGYSLVNARIGFRAADGWDVYLWARNLADTEYYELLAAQSGGSGLVVGTLGDPRTLGFTVRGRF
jgi:iron complex outermembrane receptor protein